MKEKKPQQVIYMMQIMIQPCRRNETTAKISDMNLMRVSRQKWTHSGTPS